MTKIEENSINAQVKLMSDIINNYKDITYSVTEKGKALKELLNTKKFSTDETSVIFSRQIFEQMFDCALILQNENKFDQLGILAKSAVPDNKLKIEILKLLQK